MCNPDRGRTLAITFVCTEIISIKWLLFGAKFTLVPKFVTITWYANAPGATIPKPKSRSRNWQTCPLYYSLCTFDRITLK